MKWVYRIFILCIIALVVVACEKCPEPLPRDPALGDYSGSARWAYELAEPHFAELLPDDAVLYEIHSLYVGRDGRLAANCGSWQFNLWSESLERSRDFWVKHDGEVSRVSWGADPPDTWPPIPDGWLNSTEIYEAVCPGCLSSPFGLAWLNVAVPRDGQPVWWLANLNNQIVRWDGVPVEFP
jgi:hypothetical protein